MIHWTTLTHDPVDTRVREQIIQYLLSIRKSIAVPYGEYLAHEVKGKTALDVGICEHTLERMQSPKWKHNFIKNSAAYSLGG